ncbi:hypothetical protein RJT34_17526 [Clitoria ternatea]|uniref:Uncharacterized protein n=1 Tax=Clitoria ternatea TaxID=43366 RepID=A0AAN9PDV3_CLITE
MGDDNQPHIADIRIRPRRPDPGIVTVRLSRAILGVPDPVGALTITFRARFVLDLRDVDPFFPIILLPPPPPADEEDMEGASSGRFSLFLLHPLTLPHANNPPIIRSSNSVSSREFIVFDFVRVVR